MSDLNESQKKIAEHSEGMLVVDAGPGTGKTHTIVRRYVNIISKPDVRSEEVLLLTFTNNAAEEMEQRAKAAMSGLEGRGPSKDVRAKTFDAFCLSVVLEFAEDVSEFFDIKESLSRSARLETNDTLNLEYFSRFFDAFNNDRGEDYGDFAVAVCQYPGDVMDLLARLMSKGVMPLREGWFGLDWESALYGDEDRLLARLRELNSPQKGKPKLLTRFDKMDKADYGPDFPTVEGLCLADEDLESAARDDRKDMMRYIHDIYFAFIRKSISDNRLTFGLTALFAFALLYGNAEVRERNRFRYVMIDEFQDTNANQLMIALLILTEPNLCVVGDWKQGIYMFRYVSIDNITDFENRAVRYRRFLNQGEKRVPFAIPEAEHIPLYVNYRSSQLIIDKSFECLRLPGSEDDPSLDLDFLDRNVVKLSQGRTGISQSMTEFRCVRVGKDGEADEVIRCVREYMWSGRYNVASRDGKTRRMRLGDIAVICRTGSGCRMVLEAAEREGIPAYMQGDLEIMSTREGKLALAWLRYVNNERDARGYPVIMADMGYPLVEIVSVKEDYTGRIPPEIDAQRKSLYRKRRRVTDLLTHLYGFYGLDNDVTHAIITTLSDAHRSSLMTLSDLSTLIENDIRDDTKYPVEASIDRDAITIMTMHKSKGLEFPAVIIPFVDHGIMPLTPRERGHLIYDDLYGIRCTEVVGRFGGYSKVCKSWRTGLVRAAPPVDYSEERRIMFVALSRAEQFATIIAGKPSKFMSGLSGDEYSDIPDVDADVEELGNPPAERPDVSGYKKRRRKLGVHDIMRLNTGEGQEAGEGRDEFPSKGIQYGNDVHADAESMFKGIPLTRRLPEHAEIKKVLDATADADLRYAEMECGLPLNGLDVTLRGTIDLLAVYPDRIDVYDYKTDETDRFEEEYRLQLSVYAHAASGYYGGRPARCHIAYVSLGAVVDFDPLPLEDIERRTSEVLSPLRDPEDASGRPCTT